jgi:hypothetical protein
MRKIFHPYGLHAFTPLKRDAGCSLSSIALRIIVRINSDGVRHPLVTHAPACNLRLLVLYVGAHLLWVVCGQMLQQTARKRTCPSY